MPDMRLVRRGRPPHHRTRRERAALAAAAAIVPALVLPATATAGTEPDTTTTAAPAPARSSLTPPSDSPFAEAVGGAALGVTGAPVVSDSAPPLPAVTAPAWLVADLDSGSVLAALDAHAPLPPASTIKLLTALAVLPSVDVDAPYTATEHDARTEGSRVGLVPDHEYTIADLEHGLLLASGNDAASALAAIVGGDDRAAALMNDTAARLGAFDTNAANPHGLDAAGQVSSAYDLALIARAVLADGHLAGLVRTRAYDFPGMDGGTFQIQNHNRLLRNYQGAIGLKTGYTSLAGHTLVAAADRDGSRIVAVVLGAEGRAEPIAEALLDWGFAARATAAPVGTLVTPADVAAAVDAVARSQNPAALQPVDAASRAIGVARDAFWGWAGAAALAGMAVIGLTLWLRRRRPAGRYSDRD